MAPLTAHRPGNRARRSIQRRPWGRFPPEPAGRPSGFALKGHALHQEGAHPFAWTPALQGLEEIGDGTLDALWIGPSGLIHGQAYPVENPRHVRHGSIGAVASAIYAIHQDGACEPCRLTQGAGVLHFLGQTGHGPVGFAGMHFMGVDKDGTNALPTIAPGPPAIERSMPNPLRFVM